MFDDPRWGNDPRERHDHDRDHDVDPRDVFTRDLNLPSGPDREIVHDARDREYSLRGSETLISARRRSRACRASLHDPAPEDHPEVADGLGGSAAVAVGPHPNILDLCGD